VHVEAVGRELPAAASLTGRLAWDEDATTRLAPPVAGRVVRLLAALGDRVNAGDALAEITSPDFGQAQADAARAATDLASAERTRERAARLLARGAIPRKDFEAAEFDLARARADAARTAERLKRWGGDASAGSAPDQLYRLRAPLGGTVVERNVNPGQEVRPDAAAPLFVVSDPTRLWVYLDVTERDVASVAKGDRLSIAAPAYPGRRFPGRLDVVGDALDPATRTIKARGSVENRERLLKAEMYVTVGDDRGESRPAPVVPLRSVLTEGASRYCFVEEAPGRFRRTPVDVGVERNGKVTVLSGLAEDARVVTDGSLFLAALRSASR
jgi:cobalt-zinc-cadmium efflux system membrane fusion protein